MAVMEKTRNWEQEEIDFLRKNFAKMTYSELGRRLERSKQAVRMKAKRLGLYKRPTTNQTESLCFDCVNARANRCPWIGEKKKIWTKAIESTFRADSVRNRKITIYKVTDCPNFAQEAMRA